MKSLIYIVSMTILLTTISTFAVDTNHKNVTLLETPYSVCWYQGVQYSEGALIKQLEHTFVCTHKYANQPQSQLVWLKADKEGQPIRLDPVKRIRVK
ncbi:DUF1496 domain-containing protein [Pseudoalteromonas byunsanensis]|uniref:DUF1496 domain-containing protein n=1 Tax=Pseudoalteromonas byunsanensis TaxID=327939 RepID=A0A1S1N4Y9_9GAMM|nr:DUF1496 domain-containing protein [Pseudoalteromonas byunsanensis]OHU94437.1 hypothetical protein BIW53_15290 [Pseudoalteromonas byunsanensis]